MNSSNIYLIVIILIFYIFFDEVCTVDIGMVTKNQIAVFSDETEGAQTMDIGLDSISTAAYDPKYNYMYVSDPTLPIGSIFRFKTTGDQAFITKPIVGRQDLPVRGMVFDHRHSTLYWTVTSHILFVVVPKFHTSSTSLLTGDVLLKLHGKILQDIAIDMDRGYVYWVNLYYEDATIERSLTDGSSWNVVVDRLTKPLNITVDEEGNTLYWTDWYNNSSRSLYSKGLWKNSTTYTLVDGAENWNPIAIALDTQNVYWVEKWTDEVWTRYNDGSLHDVMPTKVSKTKLHDEPLGLFVLSKPRPRKSSRLGKWFR